LLNVKVGSFSNVIHLFEDGDELASKTISLHFLLYGMLFAIGMTGVFGHI